MPAVQMVSPGVEHGEHILQVLTIHISPEYLVIDAGINRRFLLGQAHEFSSVRVTLGFDLIDFDMHGVLLYVIFCSLVCSRFSACCQEQLVIRRFVCILEYCGVQHQHPALKVLILASVVAGAEQAHLLPRLANSICKQIHQSRRMFASTQFTQSTPSAWIQFGIVFSSAPDMGLWWGSAFRCGIQTSFTIICVRLTGSLRYAILS